MAGLPDNLDRVRKEATDTLRTRLVALCDEADDKFFDLSQNAPADEQSLYFDAMKALRVQRPALIEGVCAGVDQGFSALSQTASAALQASGLSGTLDSLSLLDDDELDVSVAFQGMVSRARDAAATDLDHLRQRISKVLQRELEMERLPLHPAPVCEHFRVAVDRAAIPLKARLILYKFFERTVLDTLRDIIAQANQTLIQSGVLPEIKSAKPRPMPSADRDRGKKQPAAEKEAAAPADGGSAAGALSELLALVRQASQGGGGGGGGIPGLPGLPGGMGGGLPGQHAPVVSWRELPAGQLPVMHDGKLMAGGMVVQSDVPVHVIAPFELTELLTRLQQLQPASIPQGQIIDHAELVDVKGGISELIQEGEAESPQAINGADDDLINVVSMLFDFILDDKDIPSEMKALIGRLQIPMLKVALLDRNFFGMQHHPARQLVNAMAKAGTGWTREADDGLYQKVSDVIHRVLNEFIDDLGFFDQLWTEFSTFIAEREKRTTLIETRLRDREEGQAKAEDAQQRVREVIARMLAGRSLPDDVLSFIQECWQQVLYMTVLREGVDSSSWEQRNKVLQVLVWCSQSYNDAESEAKQRALLPRLMVSLRKGVEAVGISGAEPRMDTVQAALQKLIDGAEQHRVRVLAEAPAPVETSATPENKPATRPSDAVQVLRRTEEEVVIAAPPAPVPKPAVAENWLKMADGLVPGVWLEFSEVDFKVRAKIAARIRVQNKFVLVNGRGVKISEKTLEQLASDLETGVARMVSDAALFDRALESMITRLKSAPAGG